MNPCSNKTWSRSDSIKICCSVSYLFKQEASFIQMVHFMTSTKGPHRLLLTFYCTEGESCIEGGFHSGSIQPALNRLTLTGRCDLDAGGSDQLLQDFRRDKVTLHIKRKRKTALTEEARAGFQTVGHPSSQCLAFGRFRPCSCSRTCP